MTALTSTAIRALRHWFGDLADPIMELRDGGKIVRPFSSTHFAVDKEIVDADGLQRLAAELRAKRDAAKHRLMRRKQKTAPETPCGGKATVDTMKGDAILANPGNSSVKPTAEVRDKFARLSDAAPGRCADVGSNSDVPPVVTPQTGDASPAPVTPVRDEGDAAGTLDARIAALEARVAAVEGKNDVRWSAVKAAFAEVVEHLGLKR